MARLIPGSAHGTWGVVVVPGRVRLHHMPCTFYILSPLASQRERREVEIRDANCNSRPSRLAQGSGTSAGPPGSPRRSARDTPRRSSTLPCAPASPPRSRSSLYAQSASHVWHSLLTAWGPGTRGPRSSPPLNTCRYIPPPPPAFPTQGALLTDPSGAQSGRGRCRLRRVPPRPPARSGPGGASPRTAGRPARVRWPAPA